MSGIQGVDKLSTRLSSLVPDFVNTESPEFVAFLKAYFEFLEQETVVLKSQSTIDTIGLEDGSGDVIYETATISPSSQTVNKILTEQTIENPNVAADPFHVGEYIVGSKSKSVAEIKVVNGNTIFCKTISGFGFKANETVTGRTSKQTGIVSTYKESSIRANNKLLEYSDIDTTTESFLDYFQKDFMPSLEAGLNANKRTTIKHIRDLYQKKGSPESLEFLLRLLYGQEAEIRYPYDNTLKTSESSYGEERRMVVNVPILKDAPQPTDTITQYKVGSIYAQGIINVVYPVVGSETLYSLEITNISSKEFEEGETIELMDRDTKLKREGTVSGVIQDININESSIYFDHNDDGNILLEDGSGLVFETVSASLGSLYAVNDQLDFEGSKDDSDASDATSVVESIQTGQVESVYIEAGGTGYEGGDMVIFANAGTEGDGAFGMIGSAGDELFQEAGTRFGYYQFTATAGQTVFSGYDNYGQQVIYEDHNRHVFVNDVEQTTGFSTQGSILTFNSGLSAGDQVEIYTEYMRVIQEDGSVINLETTNSNIRKVTLINKGTGYSKLPICGPGGYIYPASMTGWAVGEVITGAGGATAVIALVNNEKNRLEVYRRSTDTGSFSVSEVITGGGSGSSSTILQQNVSSGTGAKLLSFSKSIGRIGTINLKTQGHNYSSDANVKSSSIHPMLITSPSVELSKDTVLTGSVSGSVASVVEYDVNTQLVKFKDMTNMFLEGESVTYPNGGTFKILAFNPFTGRGTYAGEGFINKGTTSDTGALSASGQALLDSKYYQSHSYVVRIGESINKYRSIVKDLVHPTGHIFFGEVAVTNTVDTAVPDAEHVRFRPTIVINAGGLDDFTDAQVGLATRTAQRQEIEIYSLFGEAGDLAYAPLVALVNESIPSAESDPTLKYFIKDETDNDNFILEDEIRGTGGFLLSETNGTISAYAKTGGVETGKGTEYYDSEMRSRHVNILKIVSKNMESNQVGMWTPTGGIPTTISLESGDATFDPYFVLQTNVNGGPERRPARHGKPLPINPHHEETLIYEDGTRIEREEEACLIRMEPEKPRGNHHSNNFRKGDFGDRAIMEDGTYLRLESATTVEEVEYFVTERTREDLIQRYILHEQGEALVMENGDLMTHEGASENAGTASFISFGTTYNDLNIITGQQTYDIAYYLKDETDNDDFTLEDGTGVIMSEVSKPEGIRVQDMDIMFPNTFIPKFSDHARHRTNITLSAYVKSGTN
jgi:hypothetical protein